MNNAFRARIIPCPFGLQAGLADYINVHCKFGIRNDEFGSMGRVQSTLRIVSSTPVTAYIPVAVPPSPFLERAK